MHVMNVNVDKTKTEVCYIMLYKGKAHIYSK